MKKIKRGIIDFGGGSEPDDDSGKGRDDQEQEPRIKLKSGKQRSMGQELRPVASLYSAVMKQLRDGKRRTVRKPSSAKQFGSLRARHSAAALQRVAVRLTYDKNRKPGQWRAFGTYIGRDSGKGLNDETKGPRGFDEQGDEVNTASTLASWQAAQDPNLFKLIISPEFGQELELREYTRKYMARVEKDLGIPLEWVAADHYDTDDPHVHVALRGVDRKGRALNIPREYIVGPLRLNAQQLATESLGFRSQDQVEAGRDRMIPQARFTDLDRGLLRHAMPHAEHGLIVDFSAAVSSSAGEGSKELRLQQIRRLAALEKMGLAEARGGQVWKINPTMELILRDRQKANDRLKTLYSHRAMVSDPRLPLAEAPAAPETIVGRLIATGMDEFNGKSYLMLETTRGSVVYLYQSTSAQDARRNGMSPGDFVVVTQRTYMDAKGKEQQTQAYRSFGNADAILGDSKRLSAEVFRHVKTHGSMPTNSTWAGWLGKFHSASAAQAAELQQKGRLIKTNDGRVEVATARDGQSTGHNR
jgi:type IV secretory pathway VirD2 relaxase